MLGELNDQEIDSVLHDAVIGRIGCHVAGQTYIVPVSYAYDGEHVYGHSGSGRKVAMMRENPSVCFEVEQVDDLGNWRTVIAWGTYEELTGTDAAASRQILLTRFAPLLGPVSAASSASAVPRLGPDGTPLPYRLSPDPMPAPVAAPKPGPGPARAHAPHPSAPRPTDHAAGDSRAEAVLYRIRLTRRTGRFERS
ncbi:pyridoxamine 5'-phosphate oxidase family protein [Cryobacterium sinapicolor]|uniref:Pyridoxamine 5'-phosphate oxidase family protein n=1 Tax=Cryobacterium sinapicolor TaxID=1259236 RepID=A0ABY2J6C2_9MICO|nr:pyridoxamine 5'-phosphate oxidase family protein [Cryobacterium sinapicolor]TFD00480.1 pyridoxamine 5'-phosphate oxidase family protein [Cryobacterium sinapicolor]